MDSPQEIRECLARIVAAGGRIDDLQKEWSDRYPSNSRLFRRRATKAWIAQAGKYREIRHWGKFRRALTLGVVVWGHAFTVEFEQAGLLLPGDDASHQEFSTCLRDLARQIQSVHDGVLTHLAARVRTYRIYDELWGLVVERGREVRHLLAERPFRSGRTLVGFTNLHFLREQFRFKVGDEFADVFGEHGSPEHLAEAASTVIALANEQRTLESYDFTLPLSGIDVSADFISLLRYGAALNAVRETGKLISILNYDLTMERATGPRVYRLRAPHQDLEYALRLGFIRGEIGRTSSGLNVSRRAPWPLISMISGAEDLLDHSPQLVELTDPDTPYRRVRLQVPLFPKLYESLSQVRFYEDALHEEQLSQELELPMGIQRAEACELVPGFDLDLPSLALICGDGVVGMGIEDDSGHVVMQRFRLRANEEAAEKDFEDYLSDRSRFFEMFRPFMHEYDRLDRLFGGSLVLAHNTFVHYVSQDDWSTHLERLGAIAVSSERHPVADLRPTPIDRGSAENT
jgi:hypothetical protein